MSQRRAFQTRALGLEPLVLADSAGNSEQQGCWGSEKGSDVGDVFREGVGRPTGMYGPL